MASRTIEIKVVVDLAKASKEAHAVTIKRIADEVGVYAVDAIKANGYTIKSAKVNTLMHYIRHDMTTQLVKATVRRLKKVS